jgi:hypothetical protein
LIAREPSTVTVDSQARRRCNKNESAAQLAKATVVATRTKVMVP